MMNIFFSYLQFGIYTRACLLAVISYDGNVVGDVDSGDLYV